MRNLLFILSFLLLAGCDKKPEPSYIEGNALGTTYHIIAYDQQSIRDFTKRVDSIFNAVNKSISTYVEDSDISKINRGDSSVVVDKMFADNLRLSKEIHDKTNGHFDPTVGNIVNLYGFGADKLTQKIDSSVVDSMMQYVGVEKVEIRKDNRLQKENPNIYLEFNAIGKGYAVDKIADFLKAHKIENFLVEVGGEIYAKGRNLGSDKKWRVGVDNPMQKEGEREISSVITLKDKAMATSGNYRKFRIDSLTGQKYVHTINPKTGYSNKTKILSTTVLAENCALADGYATAFMAMGLEEAKQIVQSINNIDALFIYDDNGELNEFSTKGFKALTVD